ncbi:SRPBCC domain-containing protein [Pseudarthrobacter sp. J75]|uniref:SRPBCC family protein n=1 Tax=unclassified Pseudarthrobacter TaxID=2647000 RepID=UPI002E81FDD8|nr:MULTISPECIES: SRPBCC domain-containing protein [unclassified Pseudarthrobacter]MEE2524094.1 SRPBCC domain-containing protein [Pseudarthrobacter sp. J47]MEE2530373.1 SRPBCC domain-containing protein [Pseudarthrobacter sp. J75]MEE2568855.1 SRPBCC domain-containing protein [Pseudarthrobacter sp. J64]
MFTATVDRTFALGIDKMWELWTSPEHLGAWHRPSMAFGPTLAAADVRPGGSYRLEMINPAGEVHATSGIYVDVEEPTRLAFTWKWEGADNETLVEVLLSEVDGGTNVSIIHTKLVDQADADLHLEGWTGCLNTLAELYV